MPSIFKVGLRAALFFVGACAHRHILPPELRVDNTAELLSRMHKAESGLKAYSAEIRLTYFGKEGRVRGTATVVVERPGNLRYDLQGPQGPLSAFACNGKEISSIDFVQSRYLYGPATPQHLDQLMGFAPLNLGPSGWVHLLMGGFDVPALARLRYDENEGLFVLSWQNQSGAWSIYIDPRTYKVRRAAMSVENEVLSEVVFGERDAEGLPVQLQVRVPKENLQVQAALREVEYNPQLEADVFHLEPVNGLRMDYLP